MRTPLTRRRLLAGFGTTLLVAACPRGGRPTGPADARPLPRLPPTHPIDDGDHHHPIGTGGGVCAITADNIEGPFFKAGAPHRAVLAGAKDPGDRLVVGGVVRTTTCEPLTDAELEIWQANAAGEYDLSGFRFRATLNVSADGGWEIHTIIPGRYLNGARYRPAHIHAKVRAPGHRPLTTQLYFKGDPYNDGDPFIVDSLIMDHPVDHGVHHATFDFVLERT